MSVYTDYIDKHPEHGAPIPLGHVSPYLAKVLDDTMPGWTYKDAQEVQKLMQQKLTDTPEEPELP